MVLRLKLRSCVRVLSTTLAAALLCGTVSQSASPSTIDPISAVSVVKVGALTGVESINDTSTVGIWGTDLGTMAEAGGRIYMAFGDTFGPEHKEWRSNTMAFTTDLNPWDGVRLDGWILDAQGKAKELVPGLKAGNEAGLEVTKIPTALTAVGSRLYLAYMSVRHWGPPGQWDANSSSWAYSDDQGQTWHVMEPPLWDGNSPFIELAVSSQTGRGNEGGDLVILGTPSGRFGAAYFAKVRPESILDRKAYWYFAGFGKDGNPQWTDDPNGAQPVIPAPVGEASLVWNDALGVWMYSYLNENSHNLELRTARDPWGPWGEPHTLAEARRYPALYGAFMTPSWISSDGKRFCFLMSQFQYYNVFVMAATIETREGY